MNHHHTDNENSLRRQEKSISMVFFATAGFAVIEVIGGVLTGSLSLLSDSIHMFTDAAALGISFFAAKIALVKPSLEKSFGYRRIEVVSAMANALLLWAVSGFMLREAWQRFKAPVEILTGPMLVVAGMGLAVNLVSASILRRHLKDNLNIKGAFFHVLGDMLGSAGVIAAGAVIYFTGYYRIDTFVSIFIIALILYGSSKLIADSFHILMEGTPRDISLKIVETELRKIEGVENIHELHIWSVSSDFRLLTAHLIVRDRLVFEEVLKQAVCLVSEKFGIKHSAFQIELEFIENSSCDTCPVRDTQARTVSNGVCAECQCK
ncbi:MAG: cation transporter [Elusimicrobia bacterium]|nr:cation transporter [Elusimicrobiota bacterium]